MLFRYTILGRTPGQPRTAQTYTGVVDAATPKAALLAALDAEFGDKDDGATPYERLTAGWSDTIEIDQTWGCLEDDDTELVICGGDVEFDIEVQSPEQMVRDAERHAPSDIDSIRASDRFIQ